MINRGFRLFIVAAVAIGVAVTGTPASAAGKKKTKIDTPAISCVDETGASITVQVCAPGGTGPTGLPAGFSLQWETESAYALGPDGVAGTVDDNTWFASGDARLCKASFSGNASGSTFNLTAGACTTVDIGDTLFDQQGASSNCPSTPLACGTTYVIHAFGHATSTLNRSDFTGNLTCTTAACDTGGGCVLTQGFWKTHLVDNPQTPKIETSCWPGLPGNVISLGNVSYTADQLLAIFNTSAAGGNGLIALAHQLITAKLNILEAAIHDPEWNVTQAYIDAVAAADALIGNLVVPPVGTDTLASSVTTALVATLTGFNEGDPALGGEPHCDETDAKICAFAGLLPE